MSTKAFGIYSTEGSDTNNNNLIIEAGNSHIACLALKDDKMITGFELYTFKQEETLDYTNLFSGLVEKSHLLNRTSARAKFFTNNECGLLIPAAKFDEEILNDFLDAALGEDESAVSRFNAIHGEPNLIIAYRIPSEWFYVAQHHFKLGEVQHSYTAVLQSLNPISNATVIKVQFYPGYFTAVVMKEGSLQLIQTFLYQWSDDVLYYLLSISQRFNLNPSELELSVSGMIDLKSALHPQLEKFFHNIVVEEVNKSRLAIDVSEYPSHYFTPFFNLAL
jgi:hypothetical protein